ATIAAATTKLARIRKPFLLPDERISPEDAPSVVGTGVAMPLSGVSVPGGGVGIGGGTVIGACRPCEIGAIGAVDGISCRWLNPTIPPCASTYPTGSDIA